MKGGTDLYLCSNHKCLTQLNGSLLITKEYYLHTDLMFEIVMNTTNKTIGGTPCVI